MDEVLSTILNLTAGAGAAAGFAAAAAIYRKFRTASVRRTESSAGRHGALREEALVDLQEVRQKLIEIEQDIKAMEVGDD